MALVIGGSQAIAYAESLQYTEPLFVFFIMVVAASKPVLVSIEVLINASVMTLLLRKHVSDHAAAGVAEPSVPRTLRAIHLTFLA